MRLKRFDLAVLAVLSILAVLVLAAPPASAGGCYANYGYSYQSYQQPYNYSYGYTPSYSYYTPPTYNYHYQTVYKEVLAPYPVKAIVSPDYYFSSEDGHKEQAKAHRDQLIADAAAFRALTTFANLTGGRSARAGDYVPPPGDMAPAEGVRRPAVGSARKVVPGVRPGAGAGGPRAPASEKVMAILENRCAKCHNGSDPARLDLSDPDAVSREDALDCVDQCNDNLMPKNGAALPENEFAELKAWARSKKRVRTAAAR